MEEKKTVKDFIIGTAGHVDHGKTQLVKALTGTDTDRLAEEKRRGITIELGFAHLTFADGSGAAIIDVPGHERFIKNMLAGAGGIDYALLVVAADEGVMPQTREHLGILTLLGIQHGMTVITKTDLVDKEWLEEVKLDVGRLIKDTFLAAGPMLTVSALTGRGVGELKDRLQKELSSLEPRPPRGPFRLPVDRVFSMEGFGTVVTGTLIQGSVREGQQAMIYPEGTPFRVRGLQVNNRPAEEAWAGQRVAVNLAGVKKDRLERGQVLAAPGFLESSLMLDVRLKVLPDSRRIIESGSRLHFYHGSRVALCKAVLLDRPSLAPGESCYAQLRLQEPIAAKRGDPFVVRFYSPVDTIGGGRILEPCAQKHKAGDPRVLAGLAVKEGGSHKERLFQYCEEKGGQLAEKEEAARRLELSSAEVEQLAGELLAEGRIYSLAQGIWLSARAYESLFRGLKRLLEEYHAAEPLSPGLSREIARQKLFGRKAAPQAADKQEKALGESLFKLMTEQGLIRQEGRLLALEEFRPTYTRRRQAIREELLALYREKGLEAPWLEELYAAKGKEEEDYRQVLEAMLAQGELVRVDSRMVISRQAYETAKQAAAGAFRQQSRLTLADFRDLWGTSRKYALALLEFWDGQKITKKTGEARVLTGSLE
ncbi:MAG: selenocysteine-specific translation elongation factor [Peptococcaceae bacterium]|nr:selenocysteine-specific translation elongation factor [Peptococcaceae bacterium]